jgi:hypothetical protein
MIRTPDSHALLGFQGDLLVVAGFDSAAEAAAARASLNDLLADLKRETEELYASQGGVADGDQLARIYERHGLRNDCGWEQERPISVSGDELLWELAEGVDLEDVESLLWTLGARDVIVHDRRLTDEPWREAPHPMSMPVPDDEEESDQVIAVDDDDCYVTVSIRKRILH